MIHVETVKQCIGCPYTDATRSDCARCNVKITEVPYIFSSYSEPLLLKKEKLRNSTEKKLESNTRQTF